MTTNNTSLKIAITGTTSGIGKATKEMLEARGDTVVSINRPEWDLHDMEKLQEIDLSGIDVLISNAGHDKGRHSFLESPYNAWMDVMKCNQLSPMLLTQIFVKQNPKGTVIYLTSHHDAGSIHGGAYHAAKSGLRYWIEMMRSETKKFRFVDVSIGRVRTKIRQNWGVPLTHEEENYLGSKGDVIEPEDMARQVLHVVDNEHVHEIYVKHLNR